MNYLLEINSTYYYSFTMESDTGISDIRYDPRLNLPPVISRTIGSNFYGISSIDTIQLSLNNNDGGLDSIYSMLINKPAIIKIGEGILSSGYRTIYTGIVKGINNNIQSIELSISDNRTLFNKDVSINLYSSTSYPDINIDNEDKPIPQIWGENIKIPCVCLNEMESPTPTNYTFKICDTSINILTSIDNVYLNNVLVSYSNVNLTNGTFTIAAATLGSDNFNNVTASATNGKSNAAEIIRDIIDNNISISWHENTYNTTKNNTYVTSYYIDSVIQIKTAIDKILNDTNMNIFFTYLGYLKLYFFDSNRYVNRVISNHEYTNDPVISNNLDEYVSSVLISYSPSRSNEEKKYKRINTYESEAISWNGESREIQLDTNLTSLTDVVLKGNDYLYKSKIFRETYQRAIRLDLFDNIELLDFVGANPSERDVNNDDNIYNTFEILGITDDYESLTKLITFRYIKPYPFINIFDVLVDENIEDMIDENGETILMGDYSE